MHILKILFLCKIDFQFLLKKWEDLAVLGLHAHLAASSLSSLQSVPKFISSHQSLFYCPNWGLMSIDLHHPSYPVFLVSGLFINLFLSGYISVWRTCWDITLMNLTGKVVRICKKERKEVTFFFKVQPNGKIKIKKSSHEFWAIKPKA